MKKAIYFIGLAFALLLAAASCQKAPFLTFNGQKSFTFKDTGGSETITFSCNRAWTAKSPESWITVSPAQGDANEEGVRVTITCAANTTYDSRNATVTIVSEGLSESISISQETNHGLITSPTTLELTNAEQDIDIEVQKNVQYSVAIDKECSDWISVGGTKALTTDKVTFHIAANPSYDNREGKITFKQIDGDLSQTVTVKQSQTNGLYITTSEYTIDWGGDTIEIPVTSNVEYNIEPNADWIHYVQTKALSNSIIVLSVDKNNTYESRNSSVSIKQKNGTLSIDVTIKQNGQVAVSDVVLSKSGARLIVGRTEEIYAKVLPENVTDDKTISWSSSNEMVATVTDGEITAISEGAVIITAKAGDKTAKCIIYSVPNSKLSGEFSIGPNKKIVFSHGNLQATYDGSKYIWGFNSTQYEYIGNGVGNISIDSQTAGAIVDLFGWSTNATYYGISSSSNYNNYGGAFLDWGFNISDGNSWRTLTQDEWQYLLGTSSERVGKYRIGVSVCGKTNCLVLAPDSFMGTISDSYDDSEWWTIAEPAGFVCLPAEGHRNGSNIEGLGITGCYWSSTPTSASTVTKAFSISFANDVLYTDIYDMRAMGNCVRLVTETE